MPEQEVVEDLLALRYAVAALVLSSPERERVMALLRLQGQGPEPRTAAGIGRLLGLLAQGASLVPAPAETKRPRRT